MAHRAQSDLIMEGKAMKRSVWHALLAVVAGMCGAVSAADKATSPAAYEEGSYVSNEVATLRAEVDSLRRQLDGTMTTGYDQDGKKAPPKADGAGGCGGCGDCGCNPCCCQPCCNDCCNNCCDCCNGCCCYDPGHVFVDFESTWFRYHRADGLQNDNVFDFEFAPRVTVGYVNSCGFGARVRWWEYDHSGYDYGGLYNVTVDTYNFDVELFEEVALGCSTGLEWSAGFRYNDFREESDYLGRQTFSAAGILLGARIYHSLPVGGALYAGVRAAWLMSDWGDDRWTEFDVTRVVTEASLGYEYRTCLSNGAVLALRAAVEMQNWENYVAGREVDGDVPVDVGFGGFVFGGSLTY
jgi:hypothetical protein